MTTLHFNVDESLAAAAEKKAQTEGKSLENWLAEVVAQQVSIAPQKDWVRHIVEASERLKGGSNGRSWTRDELYDE